MLRRSLARISGAVQPAGELLGEDDRGAAERILAGSDGDDMVDALEMYLCRVEPVPDPSAREVTALVAEAERHTDMVRAEQLAEHAGVSLRSLQRLFSEYIGIGPKWVIRRFRILDVTAMEHTGEPIDWAELADRLGFSDQAHLTRVFTQVVGVPPATYQRAGGSAG